MIEMIIMCHYFQKRLSWMLSSILQQEGLKQEVIFNIASMKENGRPTTEEVIEEFRSRGINIKHLIVDKEDLAYRGMLRNKQLESATGDWIFFSDTDHVFPKTFFSELETVISIPVNYKCCIASPYIYESNLEQTYALIESEKDIYIEDAFLKASKLSNLPSQGRKVAAGNMQVVNFNYLKKKTGGKYCIGDKSHDKHMFNGGMKTRSDVYFRDLIRPRIYHLSDQIHLNHKRYRRYKGVEEQR